MCIANMNLQTDCIEYKDNGVDEECIKCSALFSLSKVNVSGALVSKCLSDSLEVLTGCKTYQKVSGVYECTECNSDYSKETVTINSNQKARCLLKAHEVVQDCTNYIIGDWAKYWCNQCISGYTFQTGIGGNLCINDNNLEANCIQYKD